MIDIDKPIPYKWPYRWEQHVKEAPVMNRLLKAILEKDVPEMNCLFANGATLGGADTETLQTVLCIVADNLPVMRCLVQHGLSRLMVESYVAKECNVCITPGGYCPGLIARAYHLGAYDVMDLLAQNGFNYFNYYDGLDEQYYVDHYIIRNKDERGLKILIENGYVFRKREYQEFVINRPQVKRKSLGLDSRRFWNEIPEPILESVPLVFGRKDAQYRNERRIEDYKDMLRVHEEFKILMGRTK